MKPKLFIIGILLVATTLVRAATNDLTSALQKGLFEEEANHNLDAAAQAYQSVSTQFDKDRKLAATAIFRLGEVYRKQGRTNEATAQYERIVREFSDQQTLVTLSRKNLAGLGGKKELSNPPPLTRAASLEQKRLLEEEIKLVEQDLADLRKQLANGVVPQSEVRAKEREVLKLQQQVAALDVDAEDVASGAGAVTPIIDDEEKEIRRIQDMIKNSPDLINAKGADGEKPLASAAARGQLKVVQFLLDHGADIHGQSTALNLAALNGHKAMVELLLEHGAEVNSSDSSGRTALHVAAENGFQSVAEALLARKADVNAQTKKQESPLILAAAKGHSAMVDLLIAKGAQLDAKDARGWAALTTAAIQGHALIVKRMLDARADPNIPDGSGRTALSYAVQRGSTDVVKLLLEGKADPNAGSSESPLFLAVRADNTTLAELLLRADANPNQPTDCPAVDMISVGGERTKRRQAHSERRIKRTPLQAAVVEEYPAMAKLLLQFKGDAKAKNESGSPLVMDALSNAETLKALLDAGADANARYENGPYAFIAAAGNRNSAAVELLVKHGADVNVRDDQGRTPLHIAVDNNDKRSVTLLLDAKADVNATTTSGLLTALHKAAYSGSGEIAEMLLAHGADPNLKGDTGNTPLHWAVGIGNRGIGAKKMAALLLSKGADPNLRNNDGRTALDSAKGVPAPGFGGFAPPTPPGIPARAVRQPGVTANPPNSEPVDLPTLLREHGALDDLPDFNSIRLTRGTLTPMVIFSKDSNSANRFTLFEVLASYYANAASYAAGGSFSDRLNALTQAQLGGPLSFPDLTRIRIQRASLGKPTERKEITMNLLGANNNIDCGKDVPLEFGDLIEIPEREHALAEPPVGLTDPQRAELTKCTERNVRFVVRGETAEVTLYGNGAYLSPTLKISPVQKILRSSSDLSRLKLKRPDPKSGKPLEILINAQKSNDADDLWLRSGDVIEVQEKP